MEATNNDCTESSSNQALQTRAHIDSRKSGISPDNLYRILLNKARKVEPLRKSQVPEDIEKVEELDQQTMKLIHNHWCHPLNSKMEMIVRWYKRKEFPNGFLKALKKFKCKICNLCKGARVYRQSKRMAKKITKHATKGGKLNEKCFASEVDMEEDLLKAINEDGELHLDHTHSISVGYHNKKCYLIFVV